MVDPKSSQTPTSSAPAAHIEDISAAEDPTLSSESEPEEQYDGQLPDFSDSEQSGSKKPAGIGGARLVPKPKGPPGARKKVPLAALKNKLKSAANSSKPSSLTSAANTSVATSSSTPPSTVSVRSNGKDKQKAAEVEEERDANGLIGGKGLNLTNAQLDAVIKRVEMDRPDLVGKLERLELQEAIHQGGISKEMLQGKRGLLGKHTNDMASHKFWKTQPVTKLGLAVEEIKEGAIEPNKPADQIRKEPLPLHKDFDWSTINLNNSAQLKEVYELLTHNYVEDPDASFRFDYSADFIEWALKPPGYVPDWHVGIRVASTNKLVAFISGIPMDLRIRAVTKHVTEINFLCVHKKLRSKRFTPLLIQEVTRRSHLHGIFQAIYTAGAYLPTPVSRCQYYHRNLNPQKLVKTGFSAVPRNSTIARMISHYRLPAEPQLPGLRELEKKDLKAVGRLVRAYNARFEMAPSMNNKEIEHAFFAGRGKDVDGKRVGQVVWSFVVQDPNTAQITDLFSFYSLPSTATKMTPKTLINAAYLSYYATTQTPSCADLGDGSKATPITNWQDETAEERAILKERLKLLVGDALIIASKLNFDVFNALTLQDNSLFLEDLKFGKGDGFLHYYLYNYATKPILGGIDVADKGSGVGVVML